MDRATMGVEPHLHRVLVTMTFLIHYLFDLLNASAKRLCSAMQAIVPRSSELPQITSRRDENGRCRVYCVGQAWLHRRCHAGSTCSCDRAASCSAVRRGSSVQLVV
jgi:hypothetical protein